MNRFLKPPTFTIPMMQASGIAMTRTMNWITSVAVTALTPPKDEYRTIMAAPMNTPHAYGMSRNT